MRVGIKPVNYYRDRKYLESGYDYSDIPTLLEIDAIDFGCIIKHKDVFYTMIFESKKHNFILVEPISINLENTKEINELAIKCPICGYEERESWQYPEVNEDYYCERCGAILRFDSKISLTYHVKVIIKPRIIQID